MNGSPLWQAVSIHRLHVFGLDTDTLKLAETGIKLPIVEPAWKEIHSDATGERQTHPGSPVGQRGFPQKVLLGWRPLHGGRRRAWMFYLFAKSNFSLFLPSSTYPASLPPFPCFSLPPSCVSLSPLPFLSPSLGVHRPPPSVSMRCALPSHTQGRVQLGRRKKPIEQRLAAWAVQIKKINYKEETVFFHFLLTAWKRLTAKWPASDVSEKHCFSARGQWFLFSCIFLLSELVGQVWDSQCS